MIRIKTVYFSRLTIALFFGLMLLGLWYGIIWPHALPVHSDPRPGTTLNTPPACVRIWFDSALDPAFSAIIVEDVKGRRVDKGDSGVNPADPKLLEVSLPTLQPGTYRIIWTVIGRDGHKTTGDYTFTIK